MSVYIKGINFPTDGQVLRVSVLPNGEAICSYGSDNAAVKEAIPVPDHGRLIDADAALADMEEMYCKPCNRPYGVCLLGG